MNTKIKVLLIGESWMVQTIETKGFDLFFANSYGEGTEFLKKALDDEAFSFTHMPSHKISSDFPATHQDLLESFDVIIISDVGANTFLLSDQTFYQNKIMPNKLQQLKSFVLGGGGLCMAGGYLSFSGIEGKGKYYGTPVEEVLPVNFLTYDDRQEHPEGLTIPVDPNSHPILKGMPKEIKGILGYNRAVAKEECKVIATVNQDPFIAIGSFGKGRSSVIATDCAPHWASEEFCTSEGYIRLWQQMMKWLSGSL